MMSSLAQATLWATPGAIESFGTAGFRTVEDLTAPGVGVPISTHETSWVRRLDISSESYFIKTYDYPRWRDRLRGVGRTTWLAPSRAGRELLAMQWLLDRGLGAPEPVLLCEVRSLGFLWRASIATRAVPGERIDRLLPRLHAQAASALLRALRTWVDRAHAAGFRDRNLDLRNLIAVCATQAPSGEPTDWSICKLDSPRFQIVSPAASTDTLAAADLARLGRSLAGLGHHLP